MTHGSPTPVIDWIAIFVQGDVDKLLAHRFVETDLHRPLVYHTIGSSFVSDTRDRISGHCHLLVTLGENLNSRRISISKHNSPLISLKGSFNNEHCLSCRLSVHHSFIHLASHEAVGITRLLLAFQGVFNLIMARIDHLMGFAGIVVVRLFKQMLVGGHSDQQEKCVLVNASHIAKAMLKGTINWLNDCPHGDNVVILVGHNGGFPDKSPVVHTSGFYSNFLADMAQFHMGGCVVVLENQE